MKNNVPVKRNTLYSFFAAIQTIEVGLNQLEKGVFIKPLISSYSDLIVCYMK